MGIPSPICCQTKKRLLLSCVLRLLDGTRTSKPDTSGAEIVNNITHAKDLAETNTDKGLRFMKDESNVRAVQIRAIANNNLDKFECLPRELY